MEWPCYTNARCATSKESFLLRTTGGKALSRGQEETLQKHHQSPSEGFRNTNGVLGTDRTEAIDQSGEVSSTRAEAQYEKKRICEAERKCKERNAKSNGPPDDSMTLNCSTCY